MWRSVLGVVLWLVASAAIVRGFWLAGEGPGLCALALVSFAWGLLVLAPRPDEEVNRDE